VVTPCGKQARPVFLDLAEIDKSETRWGRTMQITKTNEFHDSGRVLVIEKDPDLAAILELVLSERHEVRRVSTGSAALQTLDSMAPDVVIFDLRLADMRGSELAALMKALRRDAHDSLPSFIVTSGGSACELLPAARALGAVTALRRPFRIDDLLEGVANAITERRARQSGVFPRKAAVRPDDAPPAARSLAG
jgi:DNA-binding NtrC family response regulator